MTVLFTPLSVPKIIPNDWEQWWDVWHNNTSNLTKTHKTHNSNYAVNDTWKGITLYKNSNSIMTYDCPDLSDTPIAKNISEQVLDYIPCNIMCIRVIENLTSIDFHTDHPFPKQQIRSVLWNTYESHIWNFKLHDEVRHFTLPDESNTFFYVDNPLQHSAVYDSSKSKGLLWIYGYKQFDDNIKTLADTSAEKFKQQAWVI